MKPSRASITRDRHRTCEQSTARGDCIDSHKAGVIGGPGTARTSGVSLAMSIGGADGGSESSGMWLTRGPSGQTSGQGCRTR